MRIIVLVKQTLDPTGITIRRDKERLFVNREDYVIEAGSKAALEAALRLSAQIARCGGTAMDAGGGQAQSRGPAEVVAVSMGPPQAEEALREALAMGCDAATLVTDKAFAQADISVVSRILARTIEKVGAADLVFAGQTAADTGSGQIGPRVAEALGYAHVTKVVGCTLADSGLRVTRLWGHAHAEVSVLLPAVLSVAPEAFPPRLPHGARIMSAYRDWKVTTWDAATLGLEAINLQPRLQLRSESFPPPAVVGELLQGNPADLALEVVTTLGLQRLLG